MAIETVLEPEEAQLEEKVVQIDRVSRTVAGGRRFRFRATVIVGNRAGKVGVGIAKGRDVASAIRKAAAKAKKDVFAIPLRGATIPHEVAVKYGGASLFLKPAAPGTGIIAGGAVRIVAELAGIKDVLSKILGSNNKVNNTYAARIALRSLKSFAPVPSREKAEPENVPAEKPEKKPAAKKAAGGKKTAKAKKGTTAS